MLAFHKHKNLILYYMLYVFLLIKYDEFENLLMCVWPSITATKGANVL